MYAKFDYRSQSLNIAGITYPMDDLRKYLLIHHPSLCEKNFIRTIRTFKRREPMIFTYDWENIFSIINDTYILDNYANSRN